MQYLKSLILCLLIAVFFTSTVFAETLDELEDKKAALEEDIENGQNEIEAMEKEIEEIHAHIADLNNDILAIIGEIDAYNVQLEDKQLEIETTQKDLKKAREDEEVYSEQVDERIKVMYEYGEAEYLDILLESNNLGDFFNRLEYLQKILEYDEGMILQLEAIRSEIVAKEAQLVLEEAALENLKTEASAKKKEMEDLVVQVSLEMERVENDKELLTAQIKEWEKVDEELDAQIKKKIAESKLVFNEGTFKWPLPGHYYISSGFVNRIHPIYGYHEKHKGIDIPAPYGTQVLAAASGMVIRSNWSNSYGNVVVIDHGSGYATLYAHNSRLLVSEGEAIVRGQAIAEVGSTGWSTGNHLHFGIQINGGWVDPQQFY